MRSASTADSRLCREPSFSRPRHNILFPNLLLIFTCLPVILKVFEEAESIHHCSFYPSLPRIVHRRWIPTPKTSQLLCQTDADRVRNPVRLVVRKPVPMGSRVRALCTQVAVLELPTLSTRPRFQRISMRPTRIVGSSAKSLRATVRPTSHHLMATPMQAETSRRTTSTIAMY